MPFPSFLSAWPNAFSVNVKGVNPKCGRLNGAVAIEETCGRASHSSVSPDSTRRGQMAGRHYSAEMPAALWNVWAIFTQPAPESPWPTSARAPLWQGTRIGFRGADPTRWRCVATWSTNGRRNRYPPAGRAPIAGAELGCQFRLRQSGFGPGGINELGHRGVDPRGFSEPLQFVSHRQACVGRKKVVFFGPTPRRRIQLAVAADLG